MKKLFSKLALLALLTNISNADCLPKYQEMDMSVDKDTVEIASALSTTAIGLAVIGSKGATSTIAAGSQLMDEDSLIAQVIGAELFLDGITSSTDVAVNAATTSTAAIGILDDAKRSYRTEINLIEEARVADTTLGTTLLDLTDSINDERAADAQVTPSLVATVIRDADANEKICQNDELMNATEIEAFVQDALK